MKRANHTGTIYKDKRKLRKPYRAILTLGYDDDCRAIRKTLGYYATQKEAQQALSAWVANPTAPQKKITLAEVWQWTIDDRKRKGTSDSRMKQIIAHRDFFTPLLNRPIEDIKLPHVQAIFDTLHHSPSSLGVIKATISSVFNMAIKHDVLVKSCIKGLSLPKVTKSDMHKPMTYETLAWLWAHYQTIPVAKYMLVLAYTGMRPSELSLIALDQVYLKERYMIGGVKSDAGRNRIIPIAECIAPIIADWYARASFSRGERLLDGSYKKQYHSSMGTEINKHFPTPHKAHDGRHTFATLMSSLKVQEHIIKRIMGHALTNNITQDIYTHTDKIELIEAVNKLPTYDEILYAIEEQKSWYNCGTFNSKLSKN